MSSIDFSYLSTECPPDLGTLQTDLEALCSTLDGLDTNDPLAGGCGEWGADSTIVDFTFDSGTGLFSLTAQPAWTSILANQFNSTTFGPPVDITPLGFYNGVTMNVILTNPSDCRTMNFSGGFIVGNVITLGAGTGVSLELRDITLGAPGPIIGDKIMGYTAAAGFSAFEEVIFPIQGAISIAPSTTLNLTYETTLTTLISGATSTWFQTNLVFFGQGNLI